MFSEDTEMEHDPKIGSKESELHLYPCSQTTQPACNIPGIFTECSLSVAMYWTSWDHSGKTLKEKIF